MRCSFEEKERQAERETLATSTFCSNSWSKNARKGTPIVSRSYCNPRVHRATRIVSRQVHEKENT